jgi:hypothetical protein
MIGRFWLALSLACVLAAAFLARAHGPDESGQARTAAHLRRVALGLGERTAPELDRFLDAPRSTQAPFAPLHDELLARDAAQVFSWPPPIRFDESSDPFFERVTRWNARFGLFTVLAMVWAAGTIAGRRGVLLAAAIVAVAPLAVAQSADRGIDPLALVTLLAALASAFLLRCLRAPRLFEVLANALGAGAALGLAAACSPLAAIPFLAGALGLGYQALRGSVEQRAHALRAGLLFCGVAALFAHGPLSESLLGGIESVPTSLFGAYPAAAGRLMLGTAAPFLLGFLLSGERKGRGRATQSAILAVTLGAILWYLPATVDPLAALVAAWFEHRDALALALADHRPLFSDPFAGALALTPAVFAYPWAARELARRGLDGQRVFLLVFGVLALLVTLVVARAGGLALVAVAITLATALDPRDEGGARAPRRLWPALVLLVAIEWLAGMLVLYERGEQRGWVRQGLEFLAQESGSADDWQFPDRIARTAVVAPAGRSGLVEYHARLPMVGSVFGALDGEESMRAVARALLAEDPEGLVRLMHSRGAGWVVVGPGDLREARRLADFAGLDLDGDSAVALARRSTLAKLALDLGEHAPLPGLVRAWSARTDADSGLGASGPTLSIWRLDATTANDRPAAELRAR